MRNTVSGLDWPVDQPIPFVVTPLALDGISACPSWCNTPGGDDHVCSSREARIALDGSSVLGAQLMNLDDEPVLAVFSDDATGADLDAAGVDRLIVDTEAFLQQLRAMREQLAGRPVQNEPSDLVVAVDVARRALQSTEHTSATDADELNRAHGNLRESLRLVLRALNSEPLADADTLRLAAGRPEDAVGCGAPASVRIEGYSTRDGLAHGSLDLVAYACDQHAGEARAEWLGGLLPHSGPTSSAVCGDRFDYTTLGGGR